MKPTGILRAAFSAVFLLYAALAFPCPVFSETADGRFRNGKNVAAFSPAAAEREAEARSVRDLLSAEDLVSVQREYTDYFSTFTAIRLQVPAAEQSRAEEACAEIEDVLSRIESAVNLSDADSDIYYFNNTLAAGETMEISEDTYALVVLAKEMYALTDGAYDPSVARLVDLWGFSPRFNEDGYAPSEPYDRADYEEQLPDAAYIEAFRELAAFKEVTAEELDGKYYLTKPQTTVTVDGATYDVWLDFGGIAKGYAADRAAEILRAYGFSYGYVSVGSSSVYVMQNASAQDGKYTVYIRNPRAGESGAGGELMASVQVNDSGSSTSGDYERYYVTHNRRYCHIVSAETGEPIDTGVCTAFLAGGSAAKNDALSTALCVMGKELATEFILDELKDRTALLVWENERTGKYEIIANCGRDDLSINADAAGFVLCGYMQDGEFVYEPSSAFDWVQLGIGIAVAVIVLGVIVGLGYRNHVLKRNRSSQKK